MWEAFTTRARRLIDFAQEEAQRWNVNYVGTEHLLLGLLREPDAVSGRILRQLGFDLEAIRQAMEAQLKRGDGSPGSEMLLTPRFKRVIDLSYEEARQLNNNYIGTEHLLLGLLREGEGLAGRVLAQLGVDLDVTRQAIAQLQEEATAPAKDKKGKKETMPPPPKEEDIEPVLGDLGRLRSEEDRAFVEVVLKPEHWEEYVQVVAARDSFGYKELIAAGKILVLPVGTEIKLTHKGDRYGIRILSGDHAGLAGWISRRQFQRTGWDRSVFPPPPDS